MTNSDWFEVKRLPHAVTMIREPHHVEDVKVYLIEGERDVAVLDTGMGVGDFAGLVGSLSAKSPRILQTHAHWDHFGASHHFADVLVHPAEADWLRAGFPAARYAAAFADGNVEREHLPAGFDPSGGLPGREATGWLEDGQRIDLGKRILEVIHTPGHSSGGVSFLDRQARALFVDDLLYLGKMYIFFPDSDPVAFHESLRRVTDILDDVDTIYPAHGPSPVTTNEVREICAAYEEVWAGRKPDGDGMFYTYPFASHEFDCFSFMMPPGDWRMAIEG